MPWCKASHCSLYPGNEALDLGEYSWRKAIDVSIGDDALGHIVAYQRATRITLRKRGGKDMKLDALPFWLPEKAPVGGTRGCLCVGDGYLMSLQEASPWVFYLLDFRPG